IGGLPVHVLRHLIGTGGQHMAAVEGKPYGIALAAILLQPEWAAAVVLRIQPEAYAVVLIALNFQRLASEHDAQIALADACAAQAVSKFVRGEKVAATLQILEPQRLLRNGCAQGQRQQQAYKYTRLHGRRCK